MYLFLHNLTPLLAHFDEKIRDAVAYSFVDLAEIFDPDTNYYEKIHISPHGKRAHTHIVQFITHVELYLFLRCVDAASGTLIIRKPFKLQNKTMRQGNKII